MTEDQLRERLHAHLIEALRKRRENLGVSMNRLAEKSGLSLSMISFVERGLRKPTLDTLLRIASALDLVLWRAIKQATEETRP